MHIRSVLGKENICSTQTLAEVNGHNYYWRRVGIKKKKEGVLESGERKKRNKGSNSDSERETRGEKCLEMVFFSMTSRYIHQRRMEIVWRWCFYVNSLVDSPTSYFRSCIYNLYTSPPLLLLSDLAKVCIYIIHVCTSWHGRIGSIRLKNGSTVFFFRTNLYNVISTHAWLVVV